MKKIIIGYVSTNDPFHDKVAWSGLIYKIRESIEQAGFDVRWIPLTLKGKVLLWRLILKLYNRTIGRKNQWLEGPHFLPIVKIWGKNIVCNPAIKECDYLFFPHCAQASLYAGHIPPVIYYADATAHLMIDYYWFNLCTASRKMALDLEQRATRKALINIRSSNWAANSVINDCSCNECYVLEFGPNIKTEAIQRNAPYEKGELRILFSGVDWKRKGGDIAVATVERLREKGVNALLVVAGPREEPNSCIGKKYVEFVGFLNKNNSEDYKRYVSLYEHSHIFLLPTLAECAGVVFSEASAFGLPIYTYLTGGTGDYVVNGQNGYALPLNSTAEDFSNIIYDNVQNHTLSKLREETIRLNKEKLSWEAWASRFRLIMEKLDEKRTN